MIVNEKFQTLFTLLTKWLQAHYFLDSNNERLSCVVFTFIDICHHKSLFCTLSTYTVQHSVTHSGNKRLRDIFIGCGRSVMTNFSVFYLIVAVVLSVLFHFLFHLKMAFQIQLSGPQTFLFHCLYFLLTPIELVMKIPIRTLHQHFKKFDSHAN